MGLIQTARSKIHFAPQYCKQKMAWGLGVVMLLGFMSLTGAHAAERYTGAAKTGGASQNPTDSAWSCATSDQAVRTIRLCTPKINDPKTSDRRRIRYLMKRAKAWIVEEELWAAANDYGQVNEIDPKNEEAMLEQGKVYTRLGEHSSAIDSYTRLIKTNPKNVAALCQRGGARLQLREHEAAFDDYLAGLKFAPDDVHCLVGLGDVHESLGEHKKAFKEYAAAIASNERFWQAYYRRAALHKKRGERKMAIADYSRVLQLNSVNIYVRHQLQALGVREPYP